MARVAVVGGGLAGGAAAVALAEAGARVTLFEKRATLGGRAVAYRPSGWDEAVDNCQHVLLGCCTNLLDFYRRLGVADRLDWHERLILLDETGRRGVFRAGPLPPPLHLAPGLAGLPGLSRRDRAVLRRAVARMLLAARRRERLDEMTFRAWLGRTTTPTLDTGFWRLLLTSVLNADADRVSAARGLHFFLTGLFRHPQSFRLGVPRLNLSALHHDAVVARLTALGGEIRCRQAAVIVSDQRRLRGVRVAAAVEPFDAVVCAVPWHQLRQAAPELPGPFLEAAGRLREAALVGVHLRFAEPVPVEPVVGLLNQDVDWVFAHDGGRRLSVVVSDARSWAGLSTAAMIDRALGALRRQWELPAPVAAAACREIRATFVPEPGLACRQPGVETGIEGLHLAGEWTATGWPSTLEGAVRSGYRAAEAILGQPCLAPDLPARGLMRWFDP